MHYPVSQFEHIAIYGNLNGLAINEIIFELPLYNIPIPPMLTFLSFPVVKVGEIVERACFH